jgi:hypothetical protein
MADMDRAIAANATDEFIKLLAGPRPLLRNLGGGRILGRRHRRRSPCGGGARAPAAYPAMRADLHGERPRPTVPNSCGVIVCASPRPLPAARSRRPRPG